jgi:hypothetical protein
MSRGATFRDWQARVYHVPNPKPERRGGAAALVTKAWPVGGRAIKVETFLQWPMSLPYRGSEKDFPDEIFLFR